MAYTAHAHHLLDLRQRDYELSTRRAREAIDSGNPRCRLCMQDSTPGSSEIKWLTELPAEVRERAVAAMSALAA